MLKICCLAACVLCGVAVTGALPISAAHAQSGTASAARDLAGVWKAEEYKVRLNGDLDRSVWGDDAHRVRNVELAIEPDGDGVLKVFTAVVDSKGKAKPYSSSVTEVQLKLGESATPASGRVEPAVTVVSAEERFLDGSGDKWPVNGLTLKLHTQDADSTRMEMRYDTAAGTGSFGETLMRSGRGRPQPSKTS